MPDATRKISLAFDEVHPISNPYCLLLTNIESETLKDVKKVLSVMQGSPLRYEERFKTQKVGQTEALEYFAVIRIVQFLGLTRYEIIQNAMCFLPLALDILQEC